MITEDDNNSRLHLKVCDGLSYSTLSGEDGMFGSTAGCRFDIRTSSQPVYVDAGLEYLNKGFHHHSNHSFVVSFLGNYHIQVGEQVTIEPFTGTALSYGFNWKNWDCRLRLGCNLRAKRWDFTLGYGIVFLYYTFSYA